ncbi:Peptidoglycan-binding domain-containing protein 1 [Mycena indigotica]|uniref:Peptidoglycan-binding domain-containing protein 1 n=1 Tax=Mycena indigotica TaxID=2126181 RepID=A0A8H6TFT8_9AGAR|nr:Peptidoglycan-binding domain-containing protein 1 [Mycena indigotica]KAF7315881.1 Peptidoglycan-binding domain-containing protein 1 [Mycena indigotica]
MTLKPSSPESIYFNPFAVEQHSTTAIDVSHRSSPSRQRPVVRRRTSSSDSFTSTSSGLSIFGASTSTRHLRIRTEGGSIANGHHPLRSADLSSTFQNGAGVTRPQLSRILNIPPLVDAPSVPGADMMVEEPTADEKVVLVHEITSKDSLAGIALKYGISLAELRRANSLWSSDSIHLRKVLYIPLDKTSRAQQLAPTPLLISTEEDEEKQTPTSPTPIESASIRRVPASQLSFFPPHSRPQPESPPLIPLEPQPKHSRHVRHATAPGTASPASGPVGSPSLTSILSALPIQASTRDTIIARFSYDSTSSSYSDREEGHELDDVRRGASLDSIFNPSSGNDATPKAKSGVTAPTHSHTRTASASSAAYNNNNVSRAEYRRQGPLRTVQLEPSPVMQLPFATVRKKATRINGDFDLLGLGNGEGQGETVDWDP